MLWGSTQREGLRKVRAYSMPFRTTPTITADYDRQDKALRLAFPGDVKSTTVEELHRDVFTVLADPAVKELEVAVLELDLTRAKVLDSLGLNLVVSLYKLAKRRNEAMRMRVAVRAVYLACLAVGLDRQLELKYEGPA
jgi:ABC-type transporter Mla MlaB component